ncbi:MAG: DUF4915 domain-containing protein [Armatimonadota bacterium]
MARLLITNFTPDEGGVYLLDADTSELTRLTEQPSRGITRGPDGYYVVGTRGFVWRLAPESWEVTPIGDTALHGAHDFRWIDDHFYLVASDSNRIARFDRELRPVDDLQIIRQEDDVCHANCLAQVNGQLLLTIFTLSPGRRQEKNETDAWAYEGKVLRLDWETGGYQVLYEPLAQPHSLVWHEEQLYCCESYTSEVTLLNLREKSKEVVCRLHGFVRALVFTEGMAYVGISGWKKKQTPLQKLLTRSRMECGIVELDPATWKPRRQFTIPGQQVYDMLVLDPAP